MGKGGRLPVRDRKGGRLPVRAGLFLSSDGGPLSCSFRMWRTLLISGRSGRANLIVSGGGFCAIYFKLPDQPQLMLRLRTTSDDYELLARAWMVANAKARELGWIV